MKIWFAWKWWAGKTTLSSLIIQKLSQNREILALDLDSNVNLATALWMEKDLSNLVSFWTKKHEIMKYTGSTQMTDWENRVYLPKNEDGFYDYENNFINSHSIQKWNIKAMSLWFIEDEKRGMESMCDYYEMSKVLLNHYLPKNEIVVADLAAGIEMISRATVMSFDLIFVVTDANFKNIKVSKEILQDLQEIGFQKHEIALIPNKYLDEEDLEIIQKTFPEYRIFPWIPFDENIYKLDSEKKLSSEKIEFLDKKIQNISDFILSYPKKSQKEIFERINMLDKKKSDFLQ